MLTGALKGSAFPKIQEVQRSRVPRLKGFHGLNVSSAPKVQGLNGSRDKGLPLVDRSFQRVWRFQNSRVSGKIYRV